MADDKYVWYLGFGSNISNERFNCYIAGGTPIGSKNCLPGCREKALPKEAKPTIINHELYFSQKAMTWNNGGVAFIKNEANNSIKTFSMMYLITKQQLEDVAKQESGSSYFLTIDFDEVRKNGYNIFRAKAKYGKLLYLENDVNEIPIFTITSEEDYNEVTKPDVSYLNIIADGLRNNHGLTDKEIVEYFIDKGGISNEYSKEELLKAIEITEHLR